MKSLLHEFWSRFYSEIPYERWLRKLRGAEQDREINQRYQVALPILKECRDQATAASRDGERMKSVIMDFIAPEIGKIVAEQLPDAVMAVLEITEI